MDIDHTVPFNCVIRCDTGRDSLHVALQVSGIAARVHGSLNHIQPALGTWHRPLPATESLAEQILSLPFYPDMTREDSETVATVRNHQRAKTNT